MKKYFIFIITVLFSVCLFAQLPGQKATGMKITSTNNYLVIRAIDNAPRPGKVVVQYDVYKVKADRTYEVTNGKMEDFKAKMSGSWLYDNPGKINQYDTLLSPYQNTLNYYYKQMKKVKYSGNANIDWE